MSVRQVFAASLILLAFVFAACSRTRSGSRNDPSSQLADQFISLMNAGKNHLDQGDATRAVAIYKEAAAIVPNDADVHLNLASAHLLGGAADQAIREADEVLKLEPNSAAAYFVKGSAHLRLSNAAEAVKAFENAQKIDPGETATFFQLGIARDRKSVV